MIEEQVSTFEAIAIAAAVVCYYAGCIAFVVWVVVNIVSGK